MKRYRAFIAPIKGRTFTEKQMYEVYRDLADKTKYSNYSSWLIDMLRTGSFIEV